MFKGKELTYLYLELAVVVVDRPWRDFQLFFHVNMYMYKTSAYAEELKGCVPLE
jgi:hypothetical protein